MGLRTFLLHSWNSARTTTFAFEAVNADRTQCDTDSDWCGAELERIRGGYFLQRAGIDKIEFPSGADGWECDDGNDAGDRWVEQPDDVFLAGERHELGRDQRMVDGRVHDPGCAGISEAVSANRTKCHTHGDGCDAELERVNGRHLLSGWGIDEIELPTGTDGSEYDSGDHDSCCRLEQSDSLLLAGECNERGRDERMVDGRVYDPGCAGISEAVSANRVERHTHGDRCGAELERISWSHLLSSGDIDEIELPSGTDGSECYGRDDAGDQWVEQSDDVLLAG
jgi:hypothetical protein